MNYKNLPEETKNKIQAYTISGCAVVLFYLILQHIPAFAFVFGKLWNALSPFVFGLCFSFILVPLRNIVENNWLSRFEWKKTTKRRIAVAVSMIVLLLILTSFFSILIPQLIDSASRLASALDDYFRSVQEFITKINGNNTELASYLNKILDLLRDQLGTWLTDAQGGLNKIVSYSVSVVSTVLNFFIGLILAVYLLLDQEKFTMQFKKMTYALMPKNFADKIMYVLGLTGRMFNRFIFGKALDSLIIGILCYVIVSLMGLPYTALIAVVIGFTNMIPVFGPFLGAIPCIFILFIINPLQALEFTVFILILQQVDGNIIGPYILGDSLGLPNVWVIFAIIAGGALFGIPGMFIGVPIFAVIYILLRGFINKQLENKHLDTEKL